MQKYKLTLDEIEVTTFVATPAKPSERGTVAAHGPTGQPSCVPSCANYTCEGATCTFVIC